VPWSPTEIKDFKVGVDKLDITALLKGAPAAERVILMDDGAGGTKVVVDPDGAGGAWPDYIAHLQGVPVSSVSVENLFGTATAPAPVVAGLNLVADVWGASLKGGAGADTLNAGNGAETLDGGAGADRFVFDNLPWSASTVSDFTSGEDKLDVSALLDASGYTGSNPIADGYVKLIDSGHGDTWIYFDRDGQGAGDPWGTYVTALDGVTPDQVKASDWIF
jgi:hypothetical protein